MKKICLLFLFVLLICLPGSAHAAFPAPTYGPVVPDTTPVVATPEMQDPTGRPLRVVTRIVQPFVVDKADDPNHLCADSPVLPGENNKLFCGYSQELLQILAQKLERKLAPQALDETADEIVEHLKGGVANAKYDLAIGNMSITSKRENDIDFSIPIPIINSGIQIMTRAPEADRPHFFGNAWAALTSTTAKQFYPFLGLVLLLMIVTAVIVYSIERRRKKSFLEGEPWVKGTAEAFWWILTTIFGQEEAHPRGLFSRVIAFLWIPFGVICVSLFTATITAGLTAQQIQNTVQGIDDLQGKNVLTVSGSTSKTYLEDHGIKPQFVSTIKDAYPLLEKGDVDAIVYDAPALQYYADHEGKNKVVTVGKLLKRESYGIAVPAGSSLKEDINRALLKMQDEGSIDRLNQKWFEQK